MGAGIIDAVGIVVKYKIHSRSGGLKSFGLLNRDNVAVARGFAAAFVIPEFAKRAFVQKRKNAWHSVFCSVKFEFVACVQVFKFDCFHDIVILKSFGLFDRSAWLKSFGRFSRSGGLNFSTRSGRSTRSGGSVVRVVYVCARGLTCERFEVVPGYNVPGVPVTGSTFRRSCRHDTRPGRDPPPVQMEPAPAGAFCRRPS